MVGREDSEWRNRLIWGDKKYVLPSLLREFTGKVDLIYIDPPFDTGANFSFTATIPDDPETEIDETVFFTKQPSVIEQKAYRDTWGRGLDSYLHWIYESATLLHELLSQNGSLYVHVGTNVSHYVKALLDEVFGHEAFVNEIVWKRQSAKSGAFEGMGQFGRIHEVILFYSKSNSWTWTQQYIPYDEEYLEGFYKYIEPSTGNRYRLSDLTAAGSRKGESGGRISVNGEEVYPAPGRHWALGLRGKETVQEAMNRLVKEERIWHERGKMPAYKRYLDEMPGVALQDVWTDVRPVPPQGDERLNYETQKPEALLRRIILASSKTGELVLDCFVGSGTTAAVAEKLNRRWIGCDLSRFAIHTTRKRLLSIQEVRPFVIQNLGKYERQAWQAAEFGNEAAQRIRAYIDFILRLYSAQPLNGYVWLHGKKGNRFLHVGPVDSPVSPLDVGQIIAEFKKSVGGGEDAPKTNGVDVLGWDFAFELNEVAKQQAAQAGVNIRFLRIPREVLDKKAIEQGDVHFFELASLDVRLKNTGMKATVTIRDFVIPPDDVPADIQKEITHWSQWVDYWAVDWDNKDDTFHNEVQEYRTRNKPKLAMELSKEYEKHGEYRVMVKVIDILGNDTTKMLVVRV